MSPGAGPERRGSDAAVIGRDAERDRVLGAFTRAGAVRLVGEPGIGKTALWTAVTEELTRRGRRVLQAAPAEAEQRLPFATIGDLLAGVRDEVLDRLPGPQARALRRALVLEGAGSADADPRAVAAGVLAALRFLAEQSELVVAVDDEQWVDAESALALRYALRRLGPVPVRWLLAHRAGLRPALDDDRLVVLDSLTLEPLSLGATARLLRTQLGLLLPRPVLTRVHARAGGNPLYSLEIGRALLGSGMLRAGEELPVPAGLEELVEERVALLPRAARDALLVAATAAVPRLDLLRATVGDDVADRLGPAESAGLVRVGTATVRFTHPLYAAAVVRLASVGERSQAHRLLATAEEDRVVRARHLALASSAPEAGLAETVQAAAHEARGRGARAAAAELYDLAARLTPPSDDAARAHRRVQSCDLLVEIGDIATALVAAADELDRTTDPAARARLTGFRLRCLAYPPETAELRAQEALAASADDDQLAAQIWLSLSLARGLTGAFAASGEAAAEAAAHARRAADDASLAHAVALRATTDLVTGREDPRGYLRPALAAERRVPCRSLYHAPSTMVALAALLDDDLAAARLLLAERRRIALDQGDDLALAQITLHLAEIAVREGDLGRARSWADAAVATCEEASLLQSGAFFYVRALTEAHAGALAEARADAHEALRRSLAIGDVIFAAQARAVLGFVEVSAGRYGDALVPLRQVADDLRRAGEDHSPLFGYRADLVDALLATGEVDQASALVEELCAGASRHHRGSLEVHARRAAAQLAARRGDATQAVALAEQAEAAAAGLAMPFEQARTTLVLGVALRRGGHKRRARQELERADSVFSRIGAVRWRERCRVEQSRIGGRRPAGSALTPTETLVADLAAAGRTNSEIAAELHLAAKTVEANLSRIYRKLGVRSRTELAADLRRQAGRSPS